ncbi:MAG: hypothetical protein M5U14_01305 [Acidimicrobiia bacterium]|nr:hypothetical protein [Acidimicrobiia bacterium]
MARSTPPLFPTDDGWPYPDDLVEPVGDGDVDLDLLELRAHPHAFDDLTPRELDVLTRRFGLAGPPVSVRALSHELGCTRAETRRLLTQALDKLRIRFASE